MTDETGVRIAVALEALVMILHRAVSLGDEEAESGPLMVMTQQGMVQVGK
jgi:hypothetical protein